MMPSEAEISAAAMELRLGRGCDQAMTFPCPFCNWPPEDQRTVITGQTADYETGCMYLARAALEAAELVRAAADVSPTQLSIARDAFQKIGEIAVEPGADAMPALLEAQRIADDAMREAGLRAQ